MRLFADQTIQAEFAGSGEQQEEEHS